MGLLVLARPWWGLAALLGVAFAAGALAAVALTCAVEAVEAGTGPSLAAVAPILARPDAGGIQVAKRYGVPMHIEQIEIDGMEMLLCAVGDREACRLALPQVADGVSRILAN